MAAVLEYFPFDNQPSYETQWREMGQHFISTGIIVEGTDLDEFAGDCVVEGGTGLSVEVQTGKAWIEGHFFKHTVDPVVLAISANSSGSTRTDLVVLRCDFVNNNMQYMVLQNTITPVRNSNVWDLPLARVAVPNGAVNSSSFTITDKRLFAIYSGGLVPTIRRFGASFTLAHNVQSAVNLSSGFDWMTDYRMYPGTDNTRIYITQDGFYELNVAATFSSVSGTMVGNPRRIVRARINGSALTAIQQVYAINTGIALSAHSVERLFEGDYIQLEVFHDYGAGSTLTVSNPSLSLHYKGPISA